MTIKSRSKSAAAFARRIPESAILLVLYAAVGSVIYNMNRHTVMVSDDFSKSLAASSLHGLSQVVHYLYDFYMAWGGENMG